MFELRRTIDPVRSLAGYFFAVARSHAIRLLAARARFASLDASLPDLAARTENADPSAADANRERIDEALRAMDDVDVAVLRAYAEAEDDRAWSAAVARELGLTENAVRVRKHRALRKLANLLDSVGGPHEPGA